MSLQVSFVISAMNWVPNVKNSAQALWKNNRNKLQLFMRDYSSDGKLLAHEHDYLWQQCKLFEKSLIVNKYRLTGKYPGSAGNDLLIGVLHGLSS